MANPVDVPEDDFLIVSDIFGGFALFGCGDQSEVGLNKLFIGHSSELIDALFVGAVLVGVVEFDLS